MFLKILRRDGARIESGHKFPPGMATIIGMEQPNGLVRGPCLNGSDAK